MEEFVFTSEFLTDFEFEKPIENKVRVVLLLCENKRLKKAYNEELLGLSMREWVLDSVKDFETTEVIFNEKDDFKKIILPFIKDEDYTIVLFSDTPVLKKSTIYDALEYTETKNLDFCKLPRGYIIKSKSFLNGNISLTAEPNFLEKEDFFEVFDNFSLSRAKQILKNKIIEKHIKNGVVIEDLDSIIIDETVKIDKSVIIYGFNVLKGYSQIEKDVVLKEHNLIDNSVILENSVIEFCNIKNSKILKNSNIAFENIIDNK